MVLEKKRQTCIRGRREPLINTNSCERQRCALQESDRLPWEKKEEKSDWAASMISLKCGNEILNQHGGFLLNPKRPRWLKQAKVNTRCADGATKHGPRLHTNVVKVQGHAELSTSSVVTQLLAHAAP